MKPFLSVISLILIFSLFPAASPVEAQSDDSGGDEPYAGEELCLPGAYLQEPSHCLALGPSTYITEMAKMGIDYPIQPVAAIKPDVTLSILPEAYLKVTEGSIPLYGSLEDAEAHIVKAYLEAGLKYLVNLNRVEANSTVYYQLPSGDWINGGEADAGCCILQGRFQGLIFHQNPRNGFGWILTVTPVRTSPDFNAPTTGSELNREEFVQVYDVQDVNGTKWVMIGINQWIEDRVVARVTVSTQRPEGVDTDRWIEVNLEEQVMLVYEHDHLAYATMVSTGVEPFYTQPGLFKIYQKKELETMQGSFETDRSDFYYLEDVPWTMYFDQARALHGAYWHTLFGYQQSHGCVNLSPGDAQWLFNWANEGEWVYVWDPSGKTPTDPAYYSSGGA